MIENFKIKDNKVKVIYNPVEIDVIKKLSQEKVTDFKKNDEKVVIAVGRLTEAKDYNTLLKAFKIVSENIVKSKLIILGKGPLEI